jgi:hypothetical protein
LNYRASKKMMEILKERMAGELAGGHVRKIKKRKSN